MRAIPKRTRTICAFSVLLIIGGFLAFFTGKTSNLDSLSRGTLDNGKWDSTKTTLFRGQMIVGGETWRETELILKPFKALRSQDVGLDSNALSRLIRLFESFLIEQPGHPEVENNLAVCLLQRWYESHSLDDLVRAHALLSDHQKSPLFEIHFNLGLVFNELGLHHRSKACIEKLRLLSSRNADTQQIALLETSIEGISSRLAECSILDTKKDLCLDYMNCANEHPSIFRETALQAIRNETKQPSPAGVDYRNLVEKLHEAGATSDHTDILVIDLLDALAKQSKYARPFAKADERRKSRSSTDPIFQRLLRAPPDQMAPLIAEAMETLPEHQSRLLALFLYDQARFEFRTNTKKAISTAHRALTLVPNGRYFGVQGDLHGLLGISYLKLANHGLGKKHYELALDRYVQAKEPRKVARAYTRLGSTMVTIGRHQTAWKYFFKAIQRLIWLEGTESALIYHNAGFAMMVEEEWDLARAYLEEALFYARRTDPIDLVSVLRDLVRVYIALKLEAQTPSLLDEMQRSFEELSDPNLAASIAADMDISFARVNMKDDPIRALAHLEKAESYYRDTHFALVLAPLYLLKARISRKLDNFEAADSSFAKCVNQLNLRDASLSGIEKGSFYNVMRGPFYDAIAFAQFERNNSEQALLLFDQLQARVSTDLITGYDEDSEFVHDVLDPGLSNGAQWIPEGSAAMIFAVLEEQLVCWIVDATGMISHMKSIDESHVRNLIAVLNKSIRLDKDWQNPAKLLYQTLFGALPKDIWQRADRWYLIAGEWLQDVPFEVLINSDRGEPLGRTTMISRVPNLSILRHMLTAAENRSTESISQPLFIGNPAFSTRDFPHLPNLPETIAEIDGAAVRFARATRLVGKEATRESILAELASADLFHFAGHSIPDLEVPALSKLLITPSSPEDRGEFFAKDWLEINMPNLRMAILSACQTGEGFLSPGEGISFFTQAFLVKGADSVLVSRWVVDDAAGRFFMDAFYGALCDGQDSLSAFHQARLECMQSDRFEAPKHWASFQFTGIPIWAR